MNFSNRSSSSISDHQNVLPSNPYDDLIGESDDAMDVDVDESSTSVSGSDHCDSIASFSIFSDFEIQELSEEEFLEENSSESRFGYFKFRNTCDEQWMDHTHRTPAWRSTSAGRWREKQGWILQSRLSTSSLVGQ